MANSASNCVDNLKIVTRRIIGASVEQRQQKERLLERKPDLLEPLRARIRILTWVQLAKRGDLSSDPRDLLDCLRLGTNTEDT